MRFHSTSIQAIPEVGIPGHTCRPDLRPVDPGLRRRRHGAVQRHIRRLGRQRHGDLRQRHQGTPPLPGAIFPEQ